MALTILSRWVSDTVVLDMSGRLCVTEYGLRDRVHTHLKEGCRTFVLNLANVNYVDSEGLGQLISVWTSVQKAGGRMTLAQPVPRVKEILRITRLDTIFEIVEDEGRAAGAGSAGFHLAHLYRPQPYM